MFRRFLFHKAIGDKGLLLILPKPSIYPRLLLGTFVGNVIREKIARGEPIDEIEGATPHRDSSATPNPSAEEKQNSQ